MTDHPDMEEILAKLQLLRERAQCQELAQLERMFDSTPEHTWPPAPNTVHPSLEPAADGVRGHMARGNRVVMLTQRRPIKMELFNQCAEPEERLWDDIRLDVHTAWGEAPYVGDPFVYVWNVALDPDNGRWIAGPARGQLLPWGRR